MNSIRVLSLLCLIPGALSLVACQQPGQISTAGNPAVLSSLTGDNLSNEEDDDVNPVEDEDDDVASYSRGDCGNFLTAAGAVNLNAVNDASLIGESGNIDLSNAIRNLVIERASGNINIASAINASVDRLSGNIRLNTVNVSKLERVSGNICLRAKAIASMTNGSGNTHVIAESIESIEVQSGNFHIYGATVKVANGVNGNLCLHDGAKVLNLTNFSGNVKNDCK